jgi:hypothetical protein
MLPVGFCNSLKCGLLHWREAAADLGCLRKIFGRKREEFAWGWRKIYNEELLLYTRQQISYHLNIVYTVHHIIQNQLYNDPTLVQLAVFPNSHFHHKSYAFWHHDCAIIRETQCFQLTLNTSKMFLYNLMHAACHVTRTCESSCSSRVLVFILWLNPCRMFIWRH